MVSILGLGRSPGEGNGNPTPVFFSGNPMNGGALQAIVHGVTKSQTGLNDSTAAQHTRSQASQEAQGQVTSEARMC